MTISTIVIAIIGVFGRGGVDSVSPPKDEGAFKKWLNRLADALKIPAGLAVDTVPAIVRSVVGAILSFLGKALGFVAEHTWALIVFVAGLIDTTNISGKKYQVSKQEKIYLTFHGLESGLRCRYQ